VHVAGDDAGSACARGRGRKQPRAAAHVQHVHLPFLRFYPPHRLGYCVLVCLPGQAPTLAAGPCITQTVRRRLAAAIFVYLIFLLLMHGILISAVIITGCFTRHREYVHAINGVSISSC
jgi:hypothetical protein